METSADEVRDTFLITPQAEKVYSDWERNPQRIAHGVVSTMRDHTTKAIYDCSLETFEWIKKNHAHPLGNIKKEEIEHIKPAQDWEPSFAFVHLFHLLMEDRGRPPLWNEFNEFAYETAAGRKMFGSERLDLQDEIFDQELKRITEAHPTWKEPENRARFLAKASLDWRIGNAYYGFMRDMYTATALRAKGLDVRVHPLADANFRADGWIGRRLLSVFVVNPKYKVPDQQKANRVQSGRKRHVESLFPGRQFEFVALTMDGASEHGKFHFPSQAALDRVALDLNPLTGSFRDRDEPGPQAGERKSSR